MALLRFRFRSMPQACVSCNSLQLCSYTVRVPLIAAVFNSRVPILATSEPTTVRAYTGDYGASNSRCPYCRPRAASLSLGAARPGWAVPPGPPPVAPAAAACAPARGRAPPSRWPPPRGGSRPPAGGTRAPRAPPSPKGTAARHSKSVQIGPNRSRREGDPGGGGRQGTRPRAGQLGGPASELAYRVFLGLVPIARNCPKSRQIAQILATSPNRPKLGDVAAIRRGIEENPVEGRSGRGMWTFGEYPMRICTTTAVSFSRPFETNGLQPISSSPLGLSVKPLRCHLTTEEFHSPPKYLRTPEPNSDVPPCGCILHSA
eukprot:1177712-Prorocentrum_minimum.AAC.2